MAEGIAGVTKERAVAADVGPVLVRWTAPDALSNLVSVLELAADGQVRYSASTRRPTAATVKLVEDVLVAGDFYDSGEPIAAFAWPLLIQVGGLARLAGTRLELSPRGRAALARPSYEALGALWGRWLGSVSTDELARIEAIKGQRKPGTLTSAITRRAAVAAALAGLQPGAWTGAGKLLASLRAQQQPPLVAARSLRALWRLYVVDSYFGSLGHAGSRTWDLVEGRYALCVLFEYAATLGLIDVAYTDPRGARDDYRALWGADQLSCLSRYDGLSAVRVNELGAAVLHDPDALPGLGLPVPRRA
ncbi:MAG TPA: hypothetical protein VJ305_17410 [Streptosporangiaceae bacterium]|nr:hypothetical protein [Streptosporangiaceae bacterium]